MDFIYTIYPRLCILCWERQPVRDDMFCVDCLYELPYTDHFVEAENTVSRKFWGRINIEHGAALFNLYPESQIRKMMHRLKYDGKYEIGVKLGRMAATKMLTSAVFELPDFIIPVPLHYKKQKRRGYNQSTAFASGLSEISGIPYSEQILIKTLDTPSQTAKSRTDRLLNVQASFKLRKGNNLKGKHILLVDDVITTGATLESCAQVLQQIEDVKISILSIAVARNTMIG